MVSKKDTVAEAAASRFPKRQQMQEERRQKLVHATVMAIYQYGFAESTVARIAALAGISAGNVHHYFGGKDGLLEEAMRSQLSTVRTETSHRLAAAKTPMERLLAIVESNFVPAIYTPETCTAWLHFIAHATHASKLSRLARINSRRLLSNLTATLRLLVDGDTARTLATTCAAMIDGLWMQRAHGGLDDDAASAAVMAYLQVMLNRS